MKSNDEKQAQDPEHAPGNHPLGMGVGAAGGTITGAALGSSLGPLGAVTGAVLGGTFGAIAGAGIAEGIDPDSEDAYWRERFQDEPYYESDRVYDDYGPAYSLGWQLYSPHESFETAEKAMAEEWARGKGASPLGWEQARPAAKASWERVHQSHRTVD